MSTLTLAGPASGHFFAGNDHEWEFTVTIDDVPVDIGGMTCKFVMARPGSDDPVLSTEEVPATAVATPTTSGIFTVSVTNADTVDLLNTYEYQAQAENPAGDRTNVLYGYFTFKKNLISAVT